MLFDGAYTHVVLLQGHIPTFLQIHLSRALNEPYTEPAAYAQIFERGIDPNCDDPTVVHDHSIVPEKDEDWPALSEILDYRDRVRDRLRDVYTSGKLDTEGKRSRRLARAIAMVGRCGFTVLFAYLRHRYLSTRHFISKLFYSAQTLMSCTEQVLI